MTDYALTEEHRALRRTILRFCERELAEGARQRDRERTFARELWDRCGEQGLQGLVVPEELGGQGLDPLSAAVALEALGYGCPDGGLVMSICAHLLASVVPVWKHGTPEQQRRHLPDLCAGRRIACVGMTEDTAGSEPFDMAARARPDGDGFVLSARKTLITNAPVADLAVIYAATDPEKGYHGGITGFLVERGADGFQAGQSFETLGLRSCPLGELVLDDVRVGADAVLGPVGAGGLVFSESMIWERVLLVACHIGVMERLLDQAIEYARTRTAGGRPIGEHQAVGHRIADMKVQLEAARLLTYHAAWKLDRSRDVALDASITKLFVSESLVKQALDTIRTLGGYGFMAEYDAERVLRDAVGSLIYSGTSDVQRVFISRWMLGL
jgi:L-prolyl-PCP dehydrogenase